jgi:hypothetical protein
MWGKIILSAVIIVMVTVWLAAIWFMVMNPQKLLAKWQMWWSRTFLKNVGRCVFPVGMARRAGGERVIEFPYLVMFRNENGHFVSVGGVSEFKTEKEATAKAKEKREVWRTKDDRVRHGGNRATRAEEEQ